MGLTDVTLNLGLLIGLVGVVLTLRHVGRRLSWTREHANSTRRIESIGELTSIAALFGGMAVMQLGTIAEHVSQRTLPPSPWLSLFSSTVVLLLFGLSLGRLFTRWQLHRLRAVLDTESGEVTTRSNSPMPQ
jgi:hypothetical protein